MVIALVGQPNCGKSTLFNQIAGYKSISSNFPGTTVEFTKSKFWFRGQSITIVDLPGSYSLSTTDMAELETMKYLLYKDVDIIINVMDSSLLSRSLELTIELTELQKPMIIAANMVDEAQRKGMSIDYPKLQKIIGVDVVPIMASKGKGITELFSRALESLHKKQIPNELLFSKDVENIIQTLADKLPETIYSQTKIPKRFLLLKLLEGNPIITQKVKELVPDIDKRVGSCRSKLKETHGRSSDIVVFSERHALSMNIFENVVKIGKPKRDIRESIDNIVMSRWLGYPILAVILYLFFIGIFHVGSSIEEPLSALFEQWMNLLIPLKQAHPLLYHLLSGVVQGIAGGITIVLPYLVPFLIGLSVLEDIGYLPRIAFLMDTFMHRIGLHGKAIIPFILGYGCNVPAIMALRILESPRDRFIAGTLATFVPCSARMTIIFAMVGYYMGAAAALSIYIINIVVIAIIGKVMSLMLPEITPGLILEIPRYQLPSWRSVMSKSWLRIKEFIVIAWPIIIIGSIILSTIQAIGLEDNINAMFSWLTSGILGLPSKVGVTLVFGIFRKELSMIMLSQALGTTHIGNVLSHQQLFVFTMFVVFYMPCISTMGVLVRELNWRKTIFIFLLTTIVAMTLAFLSRIVFYLT